MASYSSTVITEAGLVAYWRMGEAAGTLVDVVGNKVASPTGAPTYGVTGAIARDVNTAISTAANGSYFQTPDHANFGLGNGPFSVECWLKRTTITGATYAIALSKTTQGNYYFVNNKFGFDNDTTEIARESGTTSDLLWHHFVVTHNGSGSGNTKVYKDGVDVTTNGAGIGAATSSNAAALRFGEYNAGTLNMKAALDEVAIYSVVLTAAQVAAHYNAAVDTTAPTTFRNTTATGLLAILNAFTTANPTLLRRSFSVQPPHFNTDLPCGFVGPRTETALHDAGTRTRTMTPSVTLVDKITDNAETMTRMDVLVDAFADHITTYARLMGGAGTVWSRWSVTEDQVDIGDGTALLAVTFTFPDLSIQEGRS